MIILKILKWGDYPGLVGWAPCNHRCSLRGRQKRQRQRGRGGCPFHRWEDCGTWRLNCFPRVPRWCVAGLTLEPRSSVRLLSITLWHGFSLRKKLDCSVKETISEWVGPWGGLGTEYGQLTFQEGYSSSKGAMAKETPPHSLGRLCGHWHSSGLSWSSGGHPDLLPHRRLNLTPSL